MMNMLANWKTTLAGAGVVIGALAHLLTALSTGDTSTVFHDIMAMLAGLGLVSSQDA